MENLLSVTSEQINNSNKLNKLNNLNNLKLLNKRIKYCGLVFIFLQIITLFLIMTQLYLIITPIDKINKLLDYNINNYIVKLAKIIDYACNKTDIC